MIDITVKSYDEERDADAMFELMQAEGDWTDCCGSTESEARYRVALNECITYVLYVGGKCAGFIRTRDDFGFGTYIHDLLVGKNFRGNYYGKMLIEQVCEKAKGTVYVMSDVDDYYKKCGYDKVEGRIIIIKK